MAIDDCLARSIIRSYDFNNPVFSYWHTISFPYVLYPLGDGFIFASVFFIMALSVERHQAFCSPFDHRTSFWPYFTTGILTFLATITTCMFHFQFDENGEKYVETSLNFNPNYKIPLQWMSSLWSCFSFVVILICNLRIYWQVRSMRNSSRYKSARILFLIVVIFLLCHGVRMVTASFVFFNPIPNGKTAFCHRLGR